MAPPWTTKAAKTAVVQTPIATYRCPSSQALAVIQHDLSNLRVAIGSYAAVHGTIGADGWDMFGFGNGSPTSWEVKHENTGPFVYMRLRKDGYTPAEVQEWAAWLRTQTVPVYCYLKHDERAPELAAALVQALHADRSAA